MQGSDAKQADTLYRGIIEYYRYSGLGITAAQISQRDALIAQNAVVCDDSLDERVLLLQDEYIAAEGDMDKQRQIIEDVISLLAG